MIDSTHTDVRRRAQTALGASPIYVLRDIQVEQVGGALLLSGQVDTFYHKQMAQEVVRSVASEVDVVNEVSVHGSW